MSDFATILIGTTIFLTVPVAYPAIGVMWSELTGVYNFGIEGIMLLAAITGFMTTWTTGSLLIGVVAGISVSLLCGLLLAFLSVTARTDQIVTAIGLLTVGPALSSYIFEAKAGAAGINLNIPVLPPVPIPFLSGLPIVGLAFNQPLIVYALFPLVAATHYFFYRTKTGLKFRAVGMNPTAADAMGIDVQRTRYVALLVSGLMGGLGGLAIVMAQTGFWGDNITAGRGLVAIALVRIGNWKTNLVILGSIFFAFLSASAVNLESSVSSIPYELFSAIPFLAAIGVIAASYKWKLAGQPKSLGKPYRRA